MQPVNDGPVDQGESVRRVLDQLEPAEPVHGVGDVDEQRVRHRVPGEPDQRVHHLLGVVPGRPGVPQPERGQPVGVHVLGGALQLRERGDRGPRVGGGRVVDLEQQGLVGLDDEGAVGHGRAGSRAGVGWWATQNDPVCNAAARPASPDHRATFRPPLRRFRSR